jgi:hypothetical protein
MHSCRKKYCKNFKNKTRNQYFIPLQSDINWLHPVSLGKPVSCTRNCTARCYLNIREEPAPWYAGLLHEEMCALLQSFTLLPEPRGAAGPLVGRSPASGIVQPAVTVESGSNNI